MTVEIDPRARSKKNREYGRTYYQNVGRFTRDPEQHRQALQRWRAAHPLYQRARTYEQNIDRWLAESRKREETFHIINNARERGVEWAEIRKQVKCEPISFMREVQKTWDWGNLDGRDWARRADVELVKAVCHFMTHDDADFEDLVDLLGADDEFGLLNPDAIYQDGWYHGVCQYCMPRYVVHSRFEQKDCLRQCVVCGKPFKGERGVKTCSPICAKENRRRYVNAYMREHRIPVPPKKCVVCGTKFKAMRCTKTCSLKCARELKKHTRTAAMHRWRERRKAERLTRNRAGRATLGPRFKPGWRGPPNMPISSSNAATHGEKSPINRARRRLDHDQR